MIVRQLLRSSKEGVKIYYSFSKEQLSQLENTDDSNYSNEPINKIPEQYLEIFKEIKNQNLSSESLRDFILVLSVLVTEGSLLAMEGESLVGLQASQNRPLVLRSSVFWSRAGDIPSWITILRKASLLIDDLIALK